MTSVELEVHGPRGLESLLSEALEAYTFDDDKRVIVVVRCSEYDTPSHGEHGAYGSVFVVIRTMVLDDGTWAIQEAICLNNRAPSRMLKESALELVEQGLAQVR